MEQQVNSFYPTETETTQNSVSTVPVGDQNSSTTSKRNNFLVALLSILLLLSVGAAAFFAWQTQNLVKQLSDLQNTQTPPNQDNQPSPSFQPATDLQTYVNSKYGFSFKYPLNSQLRSVANGQNQNLDPKTSSYIILDDSIYFLVSVGENTPASQRGYTESETIGNLTFAKQIFPQGEDFDSTPFTKYEISKGTTVITIEIRGNYPISESQKDILATFKFFESTTTPSPQP